MFDAFLRETFGSTIEGREAEQVRLLQEMAGAIMTGIAPRHHKAYLFYEPFGRAGKGVTEKILRALVPKEFVRAISPMHWDNEYYMAPLAGARLNVVGELPDDKRMPANAFKMVLGGDLVSGRHPAGRPIYFKNEAAHLFTSNHLPAITEQSEALFARWVVLRFPNSRLKLGLPLDPDLPDRIINAEMAGIAHWALEGARRLLANGRYSPSNAHDEIIAKWRTRNNSVEEFIQEECDLGPNLRWRRSHFYEAYTKWCLDAGRKAFAKSKVFDLVENNLTLGIACRQLHGYDTYHGLTWRPKPPEIEYDNRLDVINEPGPEPDAVTPIATGCNPDF